MSTEFTSELPVLGSVTPTNTVASQLEKHLECSVCISLICEPVTLPCGHSFCRVCLIKSLRKAKKQCVTCRSVCHVVPEEAPENIMLKNLCMTLFPDLYATRVRECEPEKEVLDATFPVFFYSNVMCCGETISLHLFEPRYRIMAQRIVHTSKKFAYVYIGGPEQESIGSVAVVVTIREIEFFEDERCILQGDCEFPRHIITDIYEEPGTRGLHYATLKEYRDKPLNDCIEEQAPVGVDGGSRMVSVTEAEASFSTVNIGAPTSLAQLKLQEIRQIATEIHELISAMPPSRHSENLVLPVISSTQIDFEMFSLHCMLWCHYITNAQRLQLLRSTDTLYRLHHIRVWLRQGQSTFVGGLLHFSRRLLSGVFSSSLSNEDNSEEEWVSITADPQT